MATYEAGPSDDSLGSARVMVPLLATLVDIGSVVDLGCKHGEWLSIFREHGVTDMAGYDRSKHAAQLIIPPEVFNVVDLTKPFTIGRTYDLAMCIEVAEHLVASAARPLVQALTTAAPVVLFSAAIPGQGGQNHVNEQPHDYWHALFAERGFHTLDCLRPAIWQDSRVAWWYRQNTFLYASRAAIDASPRLRAEFERKPAGDLHLLHDDVLRNRRVRTKLANLLPAPVTGMVVAMRRGLRG
jgi:hypothetical protein